jgi:hypothetical protein
MFRPLLGHFQEALNKNIMLQRYEVMCILYIYIYVYLIHIYICNYALKRQVTETL